MRFGYKWILCVCLFIVCVLETAKPYVINQFHYTRAHSAPVLDSHGRIGLNDSCSLCFGDESCLTMDDGRCRFYEESGSILDEGEEQDEIDIEGTTVTREEVDALFGELAEKVNQEEQFTKCVPFVSHYTDCNKENFCIGCTSCSCDSVGKWNCSQVQRCELPDTELVVDHRVLQIVIKKLTAEKPAMGNRTKRAIREPNEAELTNLEPWMYIQPQRGHVQPQTELVQAQRELVQPEDLVHVAITPVYNDELRAMTEEIFKEIKRKLLRDSEKQITHDDVESNNLQQNLSKSNPKDQDNFSFDEILSSISVNNSSPEVANAQLAEVNKTETIEFQNLLNEIRENTNEKYKKISGTIYNAKPLNSTKLDKEDTLVSIGKTSINKLNKTNFVDVLDFMEGISEIQELSTEKIFEQRKDINDGVSNIYAIYNGQTKSTKGLKNTSPNKSDINKLKINSTTKKYSDVPKIELEEIKKTARRNIQDLLLGINEIRESSTRKFQKETLNLSDFEDLSTNDDKNNDVGEESVENLNKIKHLVNKSDIRIKREVLTQNVHNMTDVKDNVTKTNLTNPVTTNSTLNNRTDIPQYPHDLNENIINPLNDIISVKLSEIKELLEVKEKIMNFTKANKLVSVLNNKSKVDIDEQHVSIYKLEILPKSTEINTRRRGEFVDGEYNLLSSDFQKFKNDLFEVMHDIVRLKKTMKVKTLPPELKYLMRALSIYIGKQIAKEKKSQKPHFLPRDRYWVRNMWRNARRYNKTVENYILQILSLIDKDLSTFNALDPLSLKAKKVLKRVIKEFYLKGNSVNDNYTSKDIEAHNNFKLLNDFKLIGNSWQDMIASLKNCDVTNRLYEMKILHLSVSADILKIQKTLEFFDFANSRRLVLFEQNQGENLLLSIENKILLTINVIKTIFEYFNENNNKLADIMIQKVEIKQNTRRTKSFLKRLKNIFKGTKFDFLKKLHNRKSTDQSEKILKLKQLTQKKILEYKNIVKKWQEKLNIVSKREKRDFYENEKQKYERNEENSRIHNTTLLTSQGKSQANITSE